MAHALRRILATVQRGVPTREMELAAAPPVRFRRRLSRPVQSMRILLAEHYGQKAKRLRAAAQCYVDDKLRELFPPARTRAPVPVAELFLRHHDGLVRRAVRWSAVEEEEAEG